MKGRLGDFRGGAAIRCAGENALFSNALHGNVESKSEDVSSVCLCSFVWTSPLLRRRLVARSRLWANNRHERGNPCWDWKSSSSAPRGQGGRLPDGIGADAIQGFLSLRYPFGFK